MGAVDAHQVHPRREQARNEIGVVCREGGHRHHDSGVSPRFRSSQNLVGVRAEQVTALLELLFSGEGNAGGFRNVPKAVKRRQNRSKGSVGMGLESSEGTQSEVTEFELERPKIALSEGKIVQEILSASAMRDIDEGQLRRMSCRVPECGLAKFSDIVDEGLQRPVIEG